MDERGERYQAEMIGNMLSALVGYILLELASGIEKFFGIGEQYEGRFKLIWMVVFGLSCLVAFLAIWSGKHGRGLWIIGMGWISGLIIGLLACGVISLPHMEITRPHPTPVPATPSTQLPLTVIPPTPESPTPPPTTALSSPSATWFKVSSGKYQGEEVLWALAYDIHKEVFGIYYLRPGDLQWYVPSPSLLIGQKGTLFADPDFEGCFIDTGDNKYGWIGKRESGEPQAGTLSFCGSTEEPTWIGKLQSYALFAYTNGLWYLNMATQQCYETANFYNSDSDAWEAPLYGVDVVDIAADGACAVAVDYESGEIGLYRTEDGRDWYRSAILNVPPGNRAVGLWCGMEGWWAFWKEGWSRSEDGGEFTRFGKDFRKAVVDSGGRYAVLQTAEEDARAVFADRSKGALSPDGAGCRVWDVALRSQKDGPPEVYMLCSDGQLYQCQWPGGFQKLECVLLPGPPSNR